MKKRVLRIDSFTTASQGLERDLKNEVSVVQSFDPTGGKNPPKKCKFTAIWDTGATNSVVTPKLAQECGLAAVRVVKVYDVSGSRMANAYLVDIELPSNVRIPKLSVTEGNFRGGDVLIGMDIIGRGDFAVSNYRGQTVFTFRTPSVCPIDFTGKAVKGGDAPAINPGFSRNSVCPLCDSGRLFKNCCGRPGGKVIKQEQPRKPWQKKKRR